MYKVKVLFRSRAGGVEFRKIYNGEMVKDRDKITIFYEEIDENGLTKTEVKIVGDNLVTVFRKGLFSNYLEFHKNYAYEGEYLTPYGKIPVSAFTRSLKVDMDGEYPIVSVDYKSSLAGEETENAFYLSVKPIKEDC